MCIHCRDCTNGKSKFLHCEIKKRKTSLSKNTLNRLYFSKDCFISEKIVYDDIRYMLSFMKEVPPPTGPK